MPRARDDVAQSGEVVDVGRAMHGDQDEPARVQAEPGRERPGPRLRQKSYEGVDHDVAHEGDLLGGQALAQEVGVGVGGRREQQVGDVVGHHAVDLFGHGAVERAQAGLEVGDADLQLGAHEGAGQRRVDVAGHDDPVGPPVGDHRLEGDHDPGRLLGVVGTAHVQVDVGVGESELVEEHARHLAIVVLARVDQKLNELAGSTAHGRHDGRDFHEVGTRADDVKDPHGASIRGSAMGATCGRWVAGRSVAGGAVRKPLLYITLIIVRTSALELSLAGQLRRPADDAAATRRRRGTACGAEERRSTPRGTARSAA